MIHNSLAAVAVSGGSDSLALTLLARQTFQKVIGITVDHRFVNINWYTMPSYSYTLIYCTHHYNNFLLYVILHNYTVLINIKFFACMLLIRLREESTLEAERAGELVKSLGLEHYILTLDWEEWKEGEGGGLPSRGKLQLAAREKRYPALLQFCQKMDIRAVMIAHHLDDQNGESFINLNRSII